MKTKRRRDSSSSSSSSEDDKNERNDSKRRSVERSRQRDSRDERQRDNSRDRTHRDRDKRRGRNDDDFRSRNERRSPQRRSNDRRDDYRGRDRRNRERSRSRNDSRDRGRPQQRRDNDRDRRRRSRSKSFDHSNANWGKSDNFEKGQKQAPVEKEKPNFGLSGKLTEETNTYKGVVIKYSEPPEARKPKRRWRLYPFKGEKAMQTLYIHRQSAYLIGRDRKIADLPVDHPSCSKQHAVLQYRMVNFTRDDGSSGKKIRPYIIDLGSANGTYINNNKIDPQKYVELLEKDVIKFGYSSREYVLLHENSKDEGQDDDYKQEDDEVVVKKEEPTD